MSAYMVDRETIAYLVNAALQGRDRGMSFYDWGNRRRLTLDDTNADEIGQLLWNENRRSVDARYGVRDDENLPGPIIF